MESIKKLLLSLIVLSLYCISSNAVVRLVIDKRSVAAVTANTAIQSSIEVIHNKTLEEIRITFFPFKNVPFELPKS